MRLGLFALAGAVLVGLVFALVAGLGRGSAAGCEVDRPAEQANAHPDAPPAGFRYSSFPPTSGPSAPEPLVWNPYERPVQQFRLLHNLLHGGVAVQWGRGVPAETISSVRAWYRADPDGIVIAPLPNLDDRIVLTAWETLSSCGTFSERSFSQFRASNRFQGPERLPREELRRGSGGLPNAFDLRVSPTPVREQATVSLVSPGSTTVEIDIRSGRASGALVRRLAAVGLFPGRRARILWDRRDIVGRRVPAGVYFAVVQGSARGGRPVAVARFRVR